MNDDDLNELTHMIADFIGAKTGVDLDIDDKYEINDMLTALLNNLGIREGGDNE